MMNFIDNAPRETEMIAKTEMVKRGAEHAKAGKQLTPFDCREIDAEILAESKLQSAMSRAKFYAQLRGAFNKGWEAEYCKMVSQ